jgi:hypothetical protein
MTSRSPHALDPARPAGAIGAQAGDFDGIIRPQWPARALLVATGMVSLNQGSELTNGEIVAPEDGIITELVLGALDKSDQSIVRWALHIKIDVVNPRNEAVITDSSGPAYAPFAALYDEGRPAPVSFPLVKDARLRFSVKNLSTTAIAYTPIIVARFRPTILV